MRNLYLLLAIVGAIVPWYFFLQFLGGDQPAGLADFIPALFVNGAAGGFTADLLISSFVFWIWMWSRMDKGPNMAIFIALNLTIGLSCALPAYLYATTPRKN